MPDPTPEDRALHDALAEVLRSFYARRHDLGHDIAAGFVALIAGPEFDAVTWWARWCESLELGEIIRAHAARCRAAGLQMADAASSREELNADVVAGQFRQLTDTISNQALARRLAEWAPIEDAPDLEEAR